MHKLFLPNEPFFQRLVENEKNVDAVIFRDPTCNVEADYSRLLFDIVQLREKLRSLLPSELFDEHGLIQSDKPYVCVLAPGNYEFVVAAFAVLALGAAFVPLAPAILPEEALHFLTKCRSSLLLTATRCSPLANEIGEYANAQKHEVTVLSIASAIPRLGGPAPKFQVSIDENLRIPPESPSLILFTSGSTGPPKGVVHSRRFLYLGYGTSTNDLFLTHRPVHWIGGLRSILNLVISGTLQEVVESKPSVLWERLREGGVTMLCCVIPMWCKLMEYYHENISSLSEAEKEQYLKPARSLRVARIGGAAPQPSILKFWRDTIGVPLEVTYGCTETGGPGLMTDSTCNRLVECNLGKVEKGVEVRLSEGDQGEIFLRNTMQFSCYLDDPKSTEAAFTPDGFFKTGDYAHRVGEEFFIEGRTSTDFVRFHGFKVPVLEVEMRLLELPFVHEACIVSVPDKDASTRVAAVVRFASSFPLKQDLAIIRQGLAPSLANFKMPTALRVLKEGEVMPMTFTGKVLRKKVVAEFFCSDGGYKLPSDVEVWDLNQTSQNVEHKAWDWAGLQGC